MKRTKFTDEQIAFALRDVPPSARPLLLGKDPFAEPEIPSVLVFLKNCAGGSNCNPVAIEHIL